MDTRMYYMRMPGAVTDSTEIYFTSSGGLAYYIRLDWGTSLSLTGLSGTHLFYSTLTKKPVWADSLCVRLLSLDFNVSELKTCPCIFCPRTELYCFKSHVLHLPSIPVVGIEKNVLLHWTPILASKTVHIFVVSSLLWLIYENFGRSNETSYLGWCCSALRGGLWNHGVRYKTVQCKLELVIIHLCHWLLPELL